MNLLMNYQVLARKWRPQNFQEVVGQEHVLSALSNALDQNRLHHAYLFAGTRGVGKTTLGRIFAKCLNCETNGVSSKPCGTCSTCQEINQGRYVDLMEIDAASRTKVEDTRDLLDNVQYAPARGRYKVYLIDEVHMLSKHSFNALLKTLEEPPEHVKFILATTDPQKLPITVLSRCLQFNLKNLNPTRISAYLKQLLTHEQVIAEDDALWQLAVSAKGSMRDALSLTDQAIAFSNGNLTTVSVRDMLGAIDHSVLVPLLSALIHNQPKAVLESVEQLSDFSPDYRAVLGDVLALLHQLTLAQLLGKDWESEHPDKEALLALAADVTAEKLQLLYQLGLIGVRDLDKSPDARVGFEMALLRMLAFVPATASQAQPMSEVLEKKP